MTLKEDVNSDAEKEKNHLTERKDAYDADLINFPSLPCAGDFLSIWFPPFLFSPTPSFPPPFCKKVDGGGGGGGSTEKGKEASLFLCLPWRRLRGEGGGGVAAAKHTTTHTAAAAAAGAIATHAHTPLSPSFLLRRSQQRTNDPPPLLFLSFAGGGLCWKGGGGGKEMGKREGVRQKQTAATATTENEPSSSLLPFASNGALLSTGEKEKYGLQLHFLFSFFPVLSFAQVLPDAFFLGGGGARPPFPRVNIADDAMMTQQSLSPPLKKEKLSWSWASR